MITITIPIPIPAKIYFCAVLELIPGTGIDSKIRYFIMARGGILGVRCGEILLILPGLGRVSAKSVNKLTDFNAPVSSPDHGYDTDSDSRKEPES